MRFSARPLRLRQVAFTLVELLVVIGIIALLVAMLMPALSAARRSAQTVVCASNLHSLGQALTAYTQQWNYYPGAGTPKRCPAWTPRLRLFLAGNRQVFYCPTRPAEYMWTDPPSGSRLAATAEDGGYGYSPGEMMPDALLTPSSYAYNAFGTHGSEVEAGLGINHLVKTGIVRVPSEMIAIVDSHTAIQDQFVVFPTKGSDGPPGDLHAGGANVLFCDGHVQWYRQKDLIVDEADPATYWIGAMWDNYHAYP